MTTGRPSPTPEAAATRAIILGALCLRSFLEHAAAGQPAEAEAERVRLLQWLNSEGLAKAVTREEEPVLEAPVGELSEEQVMTAAWRLEALAMLAWALGHQEAVPPYDEEADAEAVLRTLPPVGESTAAFRVLAGLRPKEVLESERERARLWHWRAETQLVLDQGFEDPDLDVALAVQRAGEIAVARGDLPGLLEGDFPAFGRPYHDLTDGEYGTAASIAAVRHQAMDWLCGDTEWDRAGGET